jgi:hypothetical protein
MSMPPAPAEAAPREDHAPGCGCAGHDARTERHLQMLRDLADLGMDLARTVHRQATEPAVDEAEAPAVRADLGLTFSRIARAVRQTLALEARIADGYREARAEAARRRAIEIEVLGARRKHRVGDIVQEIIESETPEADRDALLGDLEERLGDDDDAADFGERPLGELVAAICRDLGVIPDWSLWQDEPWSAEAMAATPPRRDDPPPGENPEPGESPSADPPETPWPAHDPPGRRH